MAPALFSNLFSHKDLTGLGVLQTDMHSHFIPGIDDGSRSVEDSITLLTALSEAGYKKFITTPHIQPEFFPNTREIILAGLETLKQEIAARNLTFDISAAAEYYIDDDFEDKFQTDQSLLSFGNQYILVEMSMLQKPRSFEKVVFELTLKGYKVILAHPERYPFLFEHHKIDKVQELKDADIYLQLNIMSFGGLYGEMPKKFARMLADAKLADFLGTDLHNEKQLPFLKEAIKDKSLQKLLHEKNLLNTTL